VLRKQIEGWFTQEPPSVDRSVLKTHYHYHFSGSEAVIEIVGGRGLRTIENTRARPGSALPAPIRPRIVEPSACDPASCRVLGDAVEGLALVVALEPKFN
jgi:hypothetical protein